MYRVSVAATPLARLVRVLALSCLMATQALAQHEKTIKRQEPQRPNAEALDIPYLIWASDRNGTAMHKKLVEFTYVQKRITREGGRRGKTVERVREYEAYPVKTEGRYRHVLSLIRKDGVAVSEEELKQNRLLAATEIEQAELEGVVPGNPSGSADRERYITAGIGIGPGANGEGVWVGISQFLRHCRFEAPSVVRLGGRETVALALQSCDGDLKGPRESYMTKLRGIVWIDLKDKVVVRLEAWPAPAGSERSTGILSTRPAIEVLSYVQQRLLDGIWVPLRIHLNALGKADLFNGVNKDMVFEFSEFRWFSTEIKDVELDTQRKKPDRF